METIGAGSLIFEKKWLPLAQKDLLILKPNVIF
jgi:hypothetical protein